MMRNWNAFIALVGVLSVPSSLNATPSRLFGAGPQSQAQAGTGLTYSAGTFALFTNPALLPTNKTKMDVGYQAMAFFPKVATVQLGAPAKEVALHESLGAPLLGLSTPLLSSEGRTTGLAIGVFLGVPQSAMTRVRILAPESAQFPLLAPRTEALDLFVGASFHWQNLRVGLSTQILAELAGATWVQASGDQGNTSRTTSELKAVTAPIIGAAWSEGGLSFGATYRAQLKSNVDIDLEITDLGNIELPPLSISGTAHYDPSELQLEASYLDGSWRLAAGLSLKDWSRFTGWRRQTVLCPEEDPECAATRPEKVELKTTLVPRLAMQRALPFVEGARGALRAGYFFESSPLGEQVGGSSYFDNDRHVVTLGYGLELSDPYSDLQLDLSVQQHWLSPREHEKRNSGELVSTSGTATVMSLSLGFAL